MSSIPFSRIALLLLLSAACAAQTSAPATMKDDLHILTPTVDKAKGTVTIAGNFWKEDVADWVETALSGRPSDFLHETMVCTTTTRTVLEKSFREAGFHDADQWVSSVRDFPRVRGDRFLIVAEFTMDGKPQRYSVDELMSFQGWNVSTGPYGFMFKGDPGKTAASPPEPPPAATDESDRTRILRDDPQIALTFKGLQNMSQSFADHPLAYDDWIYPMMNLGRNYSALPPKILTANADLPVTLVFQKVTEEQFLIESAKLWHDDGWKKLITDHIAAARAIDKSKADLWDLLHRPTPPPIDEGRRQVLLATIEQGYCALDAAWAKYSMEHAQFKSEEPRALAMLTDEAKRWSEHLSLKATSAAQRAIAEDLAFSQATMSAAIPRMNDAREAEFFTLSGREYVARAAALVADNQQERDYWKEEQSRLDANDPRKEWVAAVAGHLELIAARDRLAAAEKAFGQALQKTPHPDAVKPEADKYRSAVTQSRIAEIHIQQAELQFEITKREGFENDPDLPDLRQKQQTLAAELARLAAPASQP